MNRVVLMSSAEYFRVDAAINPYYEEEPVSQVAACAEVTEIAHALGRAGVEVLRIMPPEESQDGVYTANEGLVYNETAIISRLPEVRRSEEQVARAALSSLGFRIVEPPEGLRFSGQGDALRCGEFLFCGSGYRSDLAAQAFAADTLGLQRIQLQTVPLLDNRGLPAINKVTGWQDSYFYDIDLALAVLREPTKDSPALIAYCEEAFTMQSRRILRSLPSDTFETIRVSFEEARNAFATNLVSTGENVVMSDAAPLFQAELERRDFRVETPHIKELAKGGGYIRCTTLTLA